MPSGRPTYSRQQHTAETERPAADRDAAERLQRDLDSFYRMDPRRDWFLVYECQACVQETEVREWLRKYPLIVLPSRAVVWYDLTRNQRDKRFGAASELRCGYHETGTHLRLIKSVTIKQIGGKEHPIPESDWQIYGPGGPGGRADNA